MIRHFYPSTTWQPIQQALAAWKYVLPELPKPLVENPLKAGFYETFHRNTPFPAFPISDRLAWEKIDLTGYQSTKAPFDHLNEVISHGPEFRDIQVQGIENMVSYYISIDYQEAGLKQSLQYHNTVKIWFQNGKTNLNITFGTVTRYSDLDQLADLVRQIDNKTCFKLGELKNETSRFGLRRPIDPTLPVEPVVKGLEAIMDLVGYDKIFGSTWTLACPYPDSARVQAIPCYNRVAELQIPAERYEMEIVSFFNGWEAVEELRPLCGPTDRLIHPLGMLKLPKRNRLEIFLLTSSEGHQLVVSTSQPMNDLDLQKDLVARLESLGIDFKRAFSDKELLNRKSG